MLGRRDRTLIVPVIAVALVFVASSLAAADGTLYDAGVNNSSGTIFMRSGPDECKINETYVYWNEIGPRDRQGLKARLVPRANRARRECSASATAHR